MDERNIYEHIEELAELQFTMKEVCVIIEVHESFFDENEQAALAYIKGKLKAQAEVRRALVQMAKQGSTPAQKEFQKLVDMSRVEICD